SACLEHRCRRLIFAWLGLAPTSSINGCPLTGYEQSAKCMTWFSSKCHRSLFNWSGCFLSRSCSLARTFSSTLLAFLQLPYPPTRDYGLWRTLHRNRHTENAHFLETLRFLAATLLYRHCLNRTSRVHGKIVSGFWTISQN